MIQENSMAMLSKYSKDAILTGSVDHYCLVCDNYLKGEEDISSHIAKSIHKKNLKSTPYSEQYGKDHIRKVKQGYYCEYCNLFLSTKINLHVTDPEHCKNRGENLLKRVGNTITFGDIIISDTAWNGLNQDTCIICDTEFDNEQIHKTDPGHILKLIQTKIEFGVDNTTLYRMIDDKFYQCITCNLFFSLNTLDSHFNQEEHKDLIIKHTKSKEITQDKTQVVNNTAKGKQTTGQLPNENVLVKTNVPDSSRNDNLVKGAKKEKIPQKVNKPQNKLEKVTSVLDEEISKVLGAQNFVIDNDCNQKLCVLCDWIIDIEEIRNHISGRHHQTILKMHNERIKNKEAQAQALKSKVEEENQIEHTNDADESRHKNVLDNIANYQKNDIEINFETNSAKCSKCNAIFECNFEVIEKHIEAHKQKPVKKEKMTLSPSPDKPDQVKQTSLYSSPVVMKRDIETATAPTNTNKVSKERNDGVAFFVNRNQSNSTQPQCNDDRLDEESPMELAEMTKKFAKDHGFVIGYDKKAHCKVCDAKVPLHLNNMKQHVNGYAHKSNESQLKKVTPRATQTGSKPADQIKKINFEQFCEEIAFFESFFSKSIVINERFCINMHSFMLITNQAGSFHCYGCDMDIPDEEGKIKDHIDTNRHGRAVCNSFVLMSLVSEFVREIRPDIFHCGFCNIIAPDYNELNKHLETARHQEAKTGSQLLLERYQRQAPRQLSVENVFEDVLRRLLFC